MNFRNDKTKQDLMGDIKKKVFGQDKAVEDLVYFADQVCDRTERLKSTNLVGSDLPELGSMFIIAPSGTGKTHIANTYACESGMLFHKIDATQITAEGWHGDSFSNHWYAIHKALSEHPDKNIVVLIDEIDKMFADKREGSGKFDLLKVLEGGKYETTVEYGHDTRTQFTLDCDRCIFLLCGAFTGIEDYVKEHLKPGIGFSAMDSSDTNNMDNFESESDYYRSLVEPSDLQEWGTPVEIIGRISYITHLNKLNSTSLKRIINGNIEKYKNQYPSIDIKIDSDATDLIIDVCKNSEYGARKVNSTLHRVLLSLDPQGMEREGWNTAEIVASNGQLELNKFYESSFKPAVTFRKNTIVPYNLASGLLYEIEERVDGSEMTFDPLMELGDNFIDYAVNLTLKKADDLKYFEEFA